MTEQLGIVLFRVAFWAYLLAATCYVGYVIKRLNAWSKIGQSLLIAGFVLQTASLVIRTMVTGHPPFLNLYEYMLSLTWAAVLVYIALELITRNRSFGGFIVPLIAAFAFLTYRLPSHVEQIMPALRSAWRIPHIASAVLAYASFLIAFVLAILYLVRERSESNPKSFWAGRLPSLEVLDRTTYRVIAFGFLMQTTLVIMGAVWAQYAWGRFWGWDPKETWSLITWFIYAAYLHTRTTMGWRGRKSAIVAIIGFAAVIFTLFGVSLLLSGLHSYAVQ